MTSGRLFAGIALLLGIGAAFAGSPFRPASAEHRVTALELAAWIRARRPGLRVIDVRAAHHFSAYQIPTAENFPPDAFDRLDVKPDEILVVYAQDIAAAIQAIERLRSTSHSRVFVLDGGVNAWIDDVMNPERSTDVTRYFGGVARAAGADGPAGTSTADRARTLRRRGC
jgi:rhodanese-related sulfurtransferase